MARIDDLLRRIPDAQLRADLTAAIAEVRRTRDFGLVYESHLPETCRLHSHPIRRGVKATRRSADDGTLYLVASVDGPTAKLVPLRDADGLAVPADDQVPTEMPIEDIVVIAEFGDPIHPGLKRVGSIDRGGDRPAHVVINGENHHALEALQFTHAGSVDCIYIDPPFNTGARDWKYNNDYVDANDGYRHSKWLSMMERRLQLAKRLLKLDDSVLIVAIDERELNTLGLLLGQIFPGSDLQLATVVINRAGSPRPARMTRVEEYLYFTFLGDAAAAGWQSNLLVENDAAEPGSPTVWFSAIRVGSRKALRSYYTDTALFYPVLIDAESGSFHSVGPPLPMHLNPEDYEPPAGTIPIWPMSQGRQQTWRFSREKMERAFAEGTARLGRRDPSTGLRPVTYLRPGSIKAIEDGRLISTGRTSEGALELEWADSQVRSVPPVTVWNMTAHYARDYGSKLLARFIPGRDFPFPKSLYAVEDAVRVAVGNKPDAVVLDYFAGSGTTAHAVARLNHQDGGRRRSISVTNNEVSADESARLTATGLQPGDAKWESLGIFEHITRPRIEAAITGRTPDGERVKGDYRFVDEFPMADGFEENVELFKLTYQDAAAVELGLVFEAVAPLLWLRAGGQGAMIEHHDEAGFAWAQRYGVLWDTDRWQPFVAAAPETATTVFIVTDSATAFAAVTAELPAGVEPVRLYENYLTTFTINQIEPA